MAILNVDPQRVEELIKRLHQYTTETENKQKQIKNYITHLQQFWNDNHYKAFLNQFEEFDKMVQKALQMSESLLIPNLKNVKKYADEYKNMSKK